MGGADILEKVEGSRGSEHLEVVLLWVTKGLTFQKGNSDQQKFEAFKIGTKFANVPFGKSAIKSIKLRSLQLETSESLSCQGN